MFGHMAYTRTVRALERVAEVRPVAVRRERERAVRARHRARPNLTPRRSVAEVDLGTRSVASIGFFYIARSVDHARGSAARQASHTHSSGTPKASIVSTTRSVRSTASREGGNGYTSASPLALDGPSDARLRVRREVHDDDLDAEFAREFVCQTPPLERALDAALAGPTTYSPAADAPRPHHDTHSRVARPSLVWSPVVSAGRPSGPFVATTQSTRHRLYDRVCSMA